MASIPTLYAHLVSNYKFQTACYVVYVYDHLLTLPEEVDRIWTQKFNLATLLFYINRYITHCQFIILQVEFYETNWPISVCVRYVKFAGATTMCLVAVADLTMILRVYALYFGNKYILGFLLCVLAAQIVICGWAVHFGIRVPLPESFPGCVLTGRNGWIAGIWAAPLATDSIIFILTLFRAIGMVTNRTRGASTRILDVIIRDGIMYFVVIFAANLMNCLIYFLAVEDLKAMGASFSQIITAIMIARLQLNLKQAYLSRSPDVTEGSSISARPYRSGVASVFKFRAPVKMASSYPTDSDTFFTVGNLGQDLEGGGNSDGDYLKDPETEVVNSDTSCELELQPIEKDRDSRLPTV